MKRFMSFLLCCMIFLTQAIFVQAKEEEVAVEVLNLYMESLINKNDDDAAKYSFKESSIAEKSTLAKTTIRDNPISLIDYEIVESEYLDDTTIQYLINRTYNNGVTIEGNSYVKKIAGVLKVYIYNDVRKHYSKIINLDKEIHSTFNKDYISQKRAQLEICNWDFSNLST